MTVEEEAKWLAAYVREDPSFLDIYWFPAEDEVRLIETMNAATPPQEGDDNEIWPFYFGPSLEDGLTRPSAIALIRPCDVRVLTLPEGWGTWDDAVTL
jgi:hypothetical protein